MASRPGDEQLRRAHRRRPVAEAAIAGVVAGNDHVDRPARRRGYRPARSTATPNGIPHVVGVTTEGGEEFRADLVIDAGGRRSALPQWLADGRRPRAVRRDRRLRLRVLRAALPLVRRLGAARFGPLLARTARSRHSPSRPTTAPGASAWSRAPRTRRLRGVQGRRRVDERRQELPARGALARRRTHLDEDRGHGEDRRPAPRLRGRRHACGHRVLPLADSWACTNPSVGRGISIGTLHAAALRDLLRDAPADPVAMPGVARRHDGDGRTVVPRDTAFDRAASPRSTPRSPAIPSSRAPNTA